MVTARRIGILTFHRCINYGSYWQARCLAEGLRRMGYDAELLDHDSPAATRAEWRCAFQPQLPWRTPRTDYPRYAAKTRRFLAAFDALPLSRRFPIDRPEQAGPYDLVLVGSDEVWNFRHPWYGAKPIFFGEGLQAERIASYAASFGNHGADEGMDPAWAERLRGFASLSVRDENSRALIRQSVGEDPALVLDPCLQFPPPRGAAGVEKPYVAVYGHSFQDWFQHAVRRWADRAGYRLISIGYRNDWADEQRIEAGPEEFSALIAGAASVATNFFHGCVFALHHRRPFVCVPSHYRFNKVSDLTLRVGAERHLVTEETPHHHYAELLGTPLDDGIGAKIAALREQSSRYLATVLG
ncbi:MAG: polysaccharide pyruvyl transferase family protein [Sphingomonas sp.]|nr:polysaccharide pyruvyl transferase family protein [Sphingomonas sp.]